MVLIVTFFKFAISIHYADVLSLLYLSVGILLIALSVYLTHSKKKIRILQTEPMSTNGFRKDFLHEQFRYKAFSLS
jgi:hypothetical protein